MSEIVEYTLVVMVSAFFVTGSVAVYDSFSGLESNLQVEGTLATISDLAPRAIATGAASTTMTVPALTISCERGNLTVSSGSVEITHTIPVACDFAQTVAAGEHTIAFVAAGGGLELEVN